MKNANTQTQTNKVRTNKPNTKAPSKAKKAPSTPKHSKRTEAKAQRVEDFKKDGKDFSNWERMHVTSANADLENMGLNKALKHFIASGKGILTPSQLKCLKFNIVIDYIKTSKYKDLKYFSTNQIKLICQGVIKTNHLETKRQARAIAQNKRQAKK